MTHNLHYSILVLLASAAIAHSAQAGVGKVSSPEVTKGEFETIYTGVRYGDDSDSGLNNKQRHELELEYGFTDNLELGIAFHGDRDPPQGTDFKGVGLEGKYELTEQGPWLIASALKAEYVVATQAGEADEGEVKLYLRHTAGKLRLTANIGLEREVGENRGESIDLGTRLQAVYKVTDQFSPGLEWHADYGPLNDLTWSDEHYVGPIATGKLANLGQGDLAYTVGYYRGITDASANNAAKLQLGYAQQF